MDGLVLKPEIPEKDNSLDFYNFQDGRFSFWESRVGTETIVFRVREDDTPAGRSIKKGIPKGNAIYPASQENIDGWLSTHPNYKIIE